MNNMNKMKKMKKMKNMKKNMKKKMKMNKKIKMNQIIFYLNVYVRIKIKIMKIIKMKILKNN